MAVPLLRRSVFPCFTIQCRGSRFKHDPVNDKYLTKRVYKEKDFPEELYRQRSPEYYAKNAEPYVLPKLPKCVKSTGKVHPYRPYDLFDDEGVDFHYAADTCLQAIYYYLKDELLPHLREIRPELLIEYPDDVSS